MYSNLLHLCISVGNLVISSGIFEPLIGAKSYMFVYSKVKLVSLLPYFLEYLFLLRLSLVGR